MGFDEVLREWRLASITNRSWLAPKSAGMVYLACIPSRNKRNELKSSSYSISPPRDKTLAQTLYAFSQRQMTTHPTDQAIHSGSRSCFHRFPPSPSKYSPATCPAPLTRYL